VSIPIGWEGSRWGYDNSDILFGDLIRNLSLAFWTISSERITYHPRFMSEDEGHFHIRSDFPLHPNQGTHDICLGNVHENSHISFSNLLHDLRDLIILVHLSLQQSTDERNLGGCRVL
jgi:hypothetical protein